MAVKHWTTKAKLQQNNNNKTHSKARNVLMLIAWLVLESSKYNCFFLINK